jgi:hypothetical protein
VGLSPFEATAQRLGAVVGALPTRAQSLFFCCAARALLTDSVSDANDAIAAAHDFALTGRAPDDVANLLASLDDCQARLDERDVVMHDALICADISLRIASTGFNAHDGVWYVLEPQFQATSQRLFGVTDVGSDREQHDEALALQDGRLSQAVHAVEVAAARLNAQPTERDAEATCTALRPLRP